MLRVRLEEVLQEAALAAGMKAWDHPPGCAVAVYVLSNNTLCCFHNTKKCPAQFISILRALHVNNCKLWIKDL